MFYGGWHFLLGDGMYYRGMPCIIGGCYYFRGRPCIMGGGCGLVGEELLVVSRHLV